MGNLEMSTYPLSNPIKKQYVPIFWTGASGTRYEFQLDGIGTIYRPIPGVYIFSKPLANSNHSAVYVGETDSFYRRLSDELRLHHAIDSIRLHRATHICTLNVAGDRANRLYIETDLRNALKPPCNQQ
jgi:hypothetical protein